MNIKRRRLVPAYDDAFYRRFPRLFADVLEGGRSVSPITDWGIECGIGWRAEIVELPEKSRAGYRATQVKQKFGVLCFYMTRYANEMLSA